VREVPSKRKLYRINVNEVITIPFSSQLAFDNELNSSPYSSELKAMRKAPLLSSPSSPNRNILTVLPAFVDPLVISLEYESVNRRRTHLLWLRKAKPSHSRQPGLILTTRLRRWRPAPHGYARHCHWGVSALRNCGRWMEKLCKKAEYESEI